MEPEHEGKVHHYWVVAKQQTLCVLSGNYTPQMVRETAIDGTFVITTIKVDVNCPECLELLHA